VFIVRKDTGTGFYSPKVVYTGFTGQEALGKPNINLCLYVEFKKATAMAM